ncbi:oligosaccharide flippase family protein [Raineya orbicola]|uniref:oligosaccharide flippase family protein n=1 Tax=Raineya orbicola TaxID=2016530 RepID=UPI001055FFE2|nr:oligosaccharide flippase family protein [Raineya orbicola]
MQKVKKILQNEFIANTLIGIFIRGISFVVPYLLITPYLIRTLGEGQFGLISFSIGFVSLFFPFAEYGFSLTAPRDLALSANNFIEVGRITSNILLSKVVLGLICYIVAILIIVLEPTLAEKQTLHFFSLILLWGQVLMPTWLYQGLGKLKEFAIYTLLVNLFYLLVIYLFIQSEKDYLWVTFGQGVVWILVYGVALGKIIFPMKNFLVFSIKNIWSELKNGFFIFATNFLHFLFITQNIVILGFFVEGSELDNYSYAEKIYMAFRVAAGIIYQMAYPKVFLLKQQNEQLADRFLQKLTLGIFIFFGCAAILLYWEADKIISLFTGKMNLQATELLQILSFSILAYALSVPLGQKILVFYSTRVFTLILLAVVIFNMVLNLYCIPLLGAKGTAITLLLTELFFLFLSGFYVFFAKNYNSNG